MDFAVAVPSKGHTRPRLIAARDRLELGSRYRAAQAIALDRRPIASAKKNSGVGKRAQADDGDREEEIQLQFAEGVVGVISAASCATA